MTQTHPDLSELHGKDFVETRAFWDLHPPLLALSSLCNHLASSSILETKNIEDPITLLFLIYKELKCI